MESIDKNNTNQNGIESSIQAKDHMQISKQLSKEIDTDTHGDVTNEKRQIPQKILMALKHDNWVIRLKALHTVVQYPAELILPLIQEATNDVDWEIRAIAIQYLAKLSKDSTYLHVFLNALNDSEHTVVDAAAEVLKSYPQAVDGLIQKLSTKHVETLGAAIEILGHLRDDSAVEHLQPFLNDKRTMWLDDRTLAQLAAEALVRIGTAKALDYVKESEGTGYIGDSPLISHSAEVDFATGKANIASTPSEKVALLLQDLRSDNWKRSQKAARYLRDYAKKLRQQPDKKVRIQLVEASTDLNWTIRWAVAEALAWLGDTAAIPNLEAILNDKHWMVRVAAINALIELKAEDSLAKLAELLSDEHQSVREACVEAISVLGGTKAVSYLERALKDENDFVRLAAVRGISKLDNDIVITLLPQVLGDTSSHVRWFAIRRLAEIKDKSLVQYFATRLHDKDGPGWENLSIADYALQGLENIKTAHTREILGMKGEFRKAIGGNDES